MQVCNLTFCLTISTGSMYTKIISFLKKTPELYANKTENKAIFRHKHICYVVVYSRELFKTNKHPNEETHYCDHNTFTW